MADGVVDQVVQQPSHQVRVGGERAFQREVAQQLHATFAGGRPPALDRVLEELRDLENLLAGREGARVRAGQQQQLVGEPAEPLDLRQ